MFAGQLRHKSRVGGHYTYKPGLRGIALQHTHTNTLASTKTHTLKTREYRILRAQAVAFQRY